MNTCHMVLEEIEQLRKKMSQTALEKGATSCESVTQSQELDNLLNLYDKLRNKNSNDDNSSSK
ncbi:aspartyl-phosphate phosphatase Spo0E family protein [Oceanobacillus halotolerans]|uniref:aspartyl-phosphate phosphatase Spo0E family protein n=1 Tax=Oceanobacillus halotolerans TaxID=2663380 RepID=UPI0013DC36B4|nr:aspartyl-phosphate phosphatase Spo0E family protein [Oceanobacillus halotolerans]